MSQAFHGTIRFINMRRITDILEVALPARVIRRDEYIFVDAGALGSVMCHKTAFGTYEGTPYQKHRRLPVHLVIRDVHDLDGSVRLFFEGHSLSATDPTEVPEIPFVHGTVEARIDFSPT